MQTVVPHTAKDQTTPDFGYDGSTSDRHGSP